MVSNGVELESLVVARSHLLTFRSLGANVKKAKKREEIRRKGLKAFFGGLFFLLPETQVVIDPHLDRIEHEQAINHSVHE